MSRWRLSDWTLGLLVALAVLAAWEGFVVNHWPATRGCGGDFPQYYVAGTIVRQGEAERLYDQPYFRQLQESMRDYPLSSIYPPTVALLMAPLTRLSYDEALAVWWAIHAVCILATGVIFYRTTPLPKPWRINMLVALAAMTPLWIAVGIGQVAPIFLLFIAGGLTLHKRGKCGRAGLLLSLLALKPQLAVGLVLWMLLRRDLRTLLGLAAGFTLQALAVAALLGPGLWFDYLHALPAISAVTRHAHYSPLMEASFSGMASNLLWAAAGTTYPWSAAWETAAMKIAYAVTVSAAAVMLCRVVWSRRPLRAASRDPRPARGYPGTPVPRCPGAPAPRCPARQAEPAPESENYEYACGVLFLMIVPPYLILYDQTLLAVPLVMLWSSPAWRWGVALFAATTVLVANLSLVLGFSLSGFVALATMFVLQSTSRTSEQNSSQLGLTS